MNFQPWPRPVTDTLCSKVMFAMVNKPDQNMSDSNQGGPITITLTQKVMFVIVCRPDLWISDAHSPRRRLYESEARAGKANPLWVYTKSDPLSYNFYSMGSNNFAASGSIDDCWVSTGPNSFAESVSFVDGLVSMGSNSFGDSDGVDVFLDEESGALFLRTDARMNEWGIGLREVNRSSGMEIVSPMSIFLISSSGFALAMAFQFFTVPVYHFAM